MAFARKLYDRKTGLMAAGILGTCFEYWLLSKTVITDLTLFVFFNAVLIFFFWGYRRDRETTIISVIFLLDWLPWIRGLLVFAARLCTDSFLCIRRDFKEFLYLRLPTGVVLYALVAGSWYI